MITVAQLHFCKLIVAGEKPSQAYRHAYGDTVTDHSWQVLQNPRVAILIMEMRAGLNRPETAMQPAEIIGELEGIARSSITDFVHWDDDGIYLRDSRTLTPEQARLIKTVTFTDKGAKVELWSKPDALDKLARINKVYPDKDSAAGSKTFVILAPAPDTSSDEWLARVQAADARRKAVEAQLLPDDSVKFP